MPHLFTFTQICFKAKHWICFKSKAGKCRICTKFAVGLKTGYNLLIYFAFGRWENIKANLVLWKCFTHRCKLDINVIFAYFCYVANIVKNNIIAMFVWVCKSEQSIVFPKVSNMIRKTIFVLNLPRYQIWTK